MQELQGNYQMSCFQWNADQELEKPCNQTQSQSFNIEITHSVLSPVIISLIRKMSHVPLYSETLFLKAEVQPNTCRALCFSNSYTYAIAKKLIAKKAKCN